MKMKTKVLGKMETGNALIIFGKFHIVDT